MPRGLQLVGLPGVEAVRECGCDEESRAAAARPLSMLASPRWLSPSMRALSRWLSPSLLASPGAIAAATLPQNEPSASAARPRPCSVRVRAS